MTNFIKTAKKNPLQTAATLALVSAAVTAIWALTWVIGIIFGH